MAKYIMALDSGTTSNRCILFNEQGEICSVAQKEFRQYFPKPGWVEHDPVEIWESQISVAIEAMKKIGADAFLFNKDVIYSIYKQVPISVFAVSDRAHAAYHFLEGDNRKAYLPQVYEQNIAFLRKNLLKEIGYKRLYADEIAKNPDLMAEVFQGAKLPQRTVDGLLEHYLSAGRPDMVALLLQIRNTGGANK